MNQSRHGLIIALSAVGLLLALPAKAVGLGGYFEYGYSSGEMDFFDLSDTHYNANRFGVGLVMDTNVAKDSLFNYRLTLGYQYSKYEGAYGAIDVESNGFSMNNTFGFGAYRTSQLRVWAGPAVRVNVDALDLDVEGFDATDYGIGGGAQVGVNFHSGDRLSLSLAVGYAYMYVSQNVDSDIDDVRSKTFDRGEHLLTVGLSILFRDPGDRFDFARVGE